MFICVGMLIGHKVALMRAAPKVHTFECSPLPTLSKAPGETAYRNVIKCTEVGS